MSKLLIIDSAGNQCVSKRVALGETPFTESEIQDMLEFQTDFLPVEELDALFSPACCIGREVPTSAGPIDLLFVSSGGYLTVVETKLWRAPEARRKVVGQIVDYAKELVHWTYTDLERRFQKYAESRKIDEKSLHKYVSRSTRTRSRKADFHDTVSRCLSRGRFQLLIVGDGIRESVEEIADFLAQTPSLQFTLGLVELACYRGELNNGDEALIVVPRVVTKTTEITRAVVRIEMTSETADKVSVGVTTPDERPPSSGSGLSKSEFYDRLAANSDQSNAETLRKLIDELIEKNDLLDEHFTKHLLRIRVAMPLADHRRIPILNFTHSGVAQAEPKVLRQLKEVDYPVQLGETFLAAMRRINVKAVPEQSNEGEYIRKRGSADKASIGDLIPEFGGIQRAVGEFVDGVASYAD